MKYLIENINATIIFWPTAVMWGIRYNISINGKTHFMKFLTTFYSRISTFYWDWKNGFLTWRRKLMPFVFCDCKRFFSFPRKCVGMSNDLYLLNRKLVTSTTGCQALTACKTCLRWFIMIEPSKKFLRNISLHA